MGEDSPRENVAFAALQTWVTHEMTACKLI